eukprot:1155640-Pelagomonas_calceolata.AAC.3
MDCKFPATCHPQARTQQRQPQKYADEVYIDWSPRLCRVCVRASVQLQQGRNANGGRRAAGVPLTTL